TSKALRMRSETGLFIRLISGPPMRTQPGRLPTAATGFQAVESTSEPNSAGEGRGEGIRRSPPDAELFRLREADRASASCQTGSRRHSPRGDKFRRRPFQLTWRSPRPDVAHKSANRIDRTPRALHYAGLGPASPSESFLPRCDRAMRCVRCN